MSSAPASHAGGRRFESRRSRQYFPSGLNAKEFSERRCEGARRVPHAGGGDHEHQNTGLRLATGRPVDTVSLTWLAVNSRSWQMRFAILNSWEGWVPSSRRP